jgi:hypothetical protein
VVHRFQQARHSGLKWDPSDERAFVFLGVVLVAAAFGNAALRTSAQTPDLRMNHVQVLGT